MAKRKGYEQSPDYGGPERKGYRLELFLVGLFVLLMAGAALAGMKARAQTPTRQAVKVTVTDPDTLRFSNLGESVRIKDIDGPEKGHRAKCKGERELERLGSVYAEQLIAEAKDVRPVFSDPPERDRYGRYVGDVTIDGQDYGDLMIAAGYAKRWNYGKEPKPTWC